MMIQATKIINFLFPDLKFAKGTFDYNSLQISYEERMHEPANAIIGQLADIFLALNRSIGILKNALYFVVW